ncbi:MAG: FAD-dependent oxidoreductase [Alphaproteobacteria bacterium]|jgi:hypothetical protein
MTVHIIGAGMAGLSAAFALTRKGIPAVVYDAGAHAGGRCYSFYDKTLDAVLDNGTHLMLGANRALLDMLKECSPVPALAAVEHDFLFYRVPAHSFFRLDLKRPLTALMRLPEIYRLLTESVMNTPAGEADALMLFKTAVKCFGSEKGRVYLAAPSLKAAVVDPVVSFLQNAGVPFRYHQKLRHIREDRLVFVQGEVPLPEGDKVILSVPPMNLSRILVGAPELPTRTILNIHYKSEAQLPDGRRFAGLIGGSAHWVFVRDGVVSVTVSAADTLLDRHAPEILAGRIWHEIEPLLSENSRLPPHRILIDRRATLSQSRRVNAARLSADIGSSSVFLAGDGTATGLPCTIEGAVRSGSEAAEKIAVML